MTSDRSDQLDEIIRHLEAFHDVEQLLRHASGQTRQPRMVTADPQGPRRRARALDETRPGGESTDLRCLAMACGLGLSVIGILIVLGVLFVHQALALPFSELPARPGLWPGLLVTASGLALTHASRRAHPTPLPAGAAPGGNVNVVIGSQ